MTLLEDLFEAFNGALYLDQGREADIKFAKQIIFPKIDAGEFSADQDHKTALQETLQQNGDVAIVYHLLDEKGPAHEHQFHVDVEVEGRVLGTGVWQEQKSSGTSCS